MADVGFYEYVARRGDTWDSIAFKAYGIERMSHFVSRANRKYIDVLIFEGGEVLKIPIVTELEDTKTLPPWRR